MVIFAAGFIACSNDEIENTSPLPSVIITTSPDQTSENSTAVEQYLPHVTRISPKDLRNKLQTGASVAVIDTRSLDAFNSYRIAGAISMPIGELSRHFEELRAYDEVVAYCT